MKNKITYSNYNKILAEVKKCITHGEKVDKALNRE